MLNLRGKSTTTKVVMANTKETNILTKSLYIWSHFFFTMLLLVKCIVKLVMKFIFVCF